ncbi:MAG: DUF5702 domain-containing protein [Lachnospiraceae bacterium]|nr:DUF5702 domain-containing protein [Lachnospiraceae bacterium]
MLRRYRTGLKASMTIYVALMLITVVSLVLVMLESARIYLARKDVTVYSNLAVESQCAEYQPFLYDNFRFLALDAGLNGKFSETRVENTIYDYMSEEVNGNSEHSLFKLLPGYADVKDYELMTDDSGIPFVKELRSYVGKELTESTLQGLKDKYESMDVKTDEENYYNGSQKDSVDIAVEYIEAAEEAERAAADEAEETEETTEQANPESEDNNSGGIKREIRRMANQQDNSSLSTVLKKISGLDEAGLLALMTDNPESISKLQLKEEDCIEKRKLNIGTKKDCGDEAIYDRAILTYFCSKNLDCYTDTIGGDNTSDNKAIQYEMEYVACTKYSDEENLKRVLLCIFAEREAVNACYLATAKAKQEEALAAATAITLILGSPEAATAVQAGILSAWCTAESLREVRALTAGKKVEIVKSDETWNTTFSEIGTSFFTLNTVKETENGLSYKDFLCAGIILGDITHTTYRMLDVIERRMEASGFEYARMDNMMTSFTCECSYTAPTVFFNLMPLDFSNPGYYDMKETICFKYY